MSGGLRLRLFYVLLGIGCLAHELQFIARQYRWTGSFRLHLEKWGEVSPVFTALPPVIGLVVHVAIIILALGLIVARRQQIIASLLAMVVVLSLFTIAPPGISNHYIVVAFALLSTATFGAISHLTIKDEGQGAYQGTTEIEDVTLFRALKHLFVITYFFAAFHKLNEGWFDLTKTAAQEFIVPYITPLISLIPGNPVDFIHATVAIGVYATIAIEFSLPFLLLWRTTRLLGCLLAVAFNVPIMGQGVVDYPAIVLAFSPIFFSEDELRSLLSQLFSNVTMVRLGSATLLWMYIYLCSPDRIMKTTWRVLNHTGGYSLVAFGDVLLRQGLIFAWVFIGCTIVQELLWNVVLKARSTHYVAYNPNS
jgi:hypothetical protein